MTITLPIETKRLILREFEDDDWHDVHEYGADPEVVEYMPWGPNTEEETKAFIARAKSLRNHNPRTKFEIAIELKSENKVIGGCGITIESIAHKQGWIGYCFNKDYWGHGYATEVVSELLYQGFDYLGLHRIYATCDIDNTGSAKVLEKTGMIREGCLRDDMLIRGRWRDSILFSILEFEWEQSRS